MAEYMESAFNLAREALNIGEVPVGCVFVQNDVIIAQGRNTVNETHNATRHAEMVCVDQIVSKYDDWATVLKETKVVVTVEPCIMCAALLYELQVKSITYGCANDRFGGVNTVLVTSKLYPKPCSVLAGVRADETMDLLKTFYKGTNPNAPECKVKIKNK